MNEIFGMIAFDALFIGGQLLKLYCRDTGKDLEEMENPLPPARPLKPWGQGEERDAEHWLNMENQHRAHHIDNFSRRMIEAIEGH